LSFFNYLNYNAFHLYSYLNLGKREFFIMEPVIQNLLKSEDPSIRYLASTRLLKRDPNSEEMSKLQASISGSSRVKALLAERDSDGKIPYDAYSKWDGAHWVLNMLADLGYPRGDEALMPLADQVYGWLFSEAHIQRIKRVTIAGRVRMCASMEGNAIYYLLALGLADDRVYTLVDRLLVWQWPDGGWNCDKHPEAQHTSSFMESLIPLRGLAIYVKHTGDQKARKVVEEAAEIFLKRRLFKRQRDGRVIEPSFVTLHYPCYWHYDILFGLKVMMEAGFINDNRCKDALDVLESKRIPDGGFPAENKFYRVSNGPANGRSLVNWGGTSTRQMNPFVTLDALKVLQEAGRLTN
jgi:hypothetical protein